MSKSAEAEKTTFTQWLLQLPEDDELKLFCLHVKHDLEWPAEATDYETFHVYMKRVKASPKYMKRLAKAWTRFSGKAPPSNNEILVKRIADIRNRVISAKK